jgi:hypothetical protein
VCQILLQDPKYFQLLLRIDIDLAAQMRAGKCQCGGVLHSANYPRKPRGCPVEARADYASRFSFCCSQCRKRSTSLSVRFLGRRVYVSLAVVLLSTRRAGPTATTARLCETLAVPARTVLRWRSWWAQCFPTTLLWQASGARFMPPVATAELPASLMECFTGSAAESMRRLLTFLMPLSVRQ